MCQYLSLKMQRIRRHGWVPGTGSRAIFLVSLRLDAPPGSIELGDGDLRSRANG
jgi:hypothetical protein